MLQSDVPVSPAIRHNSREQLVHLLAEAAELEHNLLCCYLYTAFSIKRRGQPGLGEEQLPVVEAWRASIMQVAMEEMVHLALVANLTAAVGGKPHFNRPNMPVAPLYHPANIVVELAPFCVDTLDHFIFLERPDGSEVEDGRSFSDVAGDYQRRPPGATSIMPSAVDYETIGDFYEHLRSCVIELSGEIGEAALFCGDVDMQIGQRQLDMPGIQTIRSLAEAIAAIDTIVTQGEGSRSDQEQSHFSRFRTVRSELIALQDEVVGFAPAWPSLRNPLMRHPAPGSRGIHIGAPAAAQALALANGLYALMLRSLSAAWGKGAMPADGALSSGQALDMAMQLMGAVAALGQHLCTLPANLDAPENHAGMTFTMFRATEPIMAMVEKRWFKERLAELLTASRRVQEDQPEISRCVMQLERLLGTLDEA